MAKKKRAFITGVTGQDGAFLSDLLLKEGYEVYGGYRRTSTPNFWRLNSLEIKDKIKLFSLDLLEVTNILRAIEEIKPDEIYNLAAQSFVGDSWNCPLVTTEINGCGPIRILESIRTINPKIRFYQASTSEMCGLTKTAFQNEMTPFYPRSPYGFSKLMAHWATVNYRESFGIHASAGILMNHESEFRGEEFVTRKITKGVADIKRGKISQIELGNLDAKRDWGHAKNYVEAMFKMVQADDPGDYVVATGQVHSIREFVELAFRIGLNTEIYWKGTCENEVGYDNNNDKRVCVNKEFYRPAEVNFLCGDSTKIKNQLGWEPKIGFEELVRIMVEADIKRNN
jgi:GDPmannose 4,6-dehydratase